MSEKPWVDFHVVTPSYKRPDSVPALNVVKGIKLVVRPSEYAQYKEHYPDAEIVQLGSDVKGLPMTRQWIYDYFGNVFMIDDDSIGVNRLYIAKRKESLLSPEEAYDLIQFTGNMAIAAGCMIFGFNNNPSQLTYNPLVPIRLSGYINTSAIGMVAGSKLYFDPLFISTEDYWLCGLNAHYYRKSYADLRFVFQCEDNFEKAGGMAAYRTGDSEKQDTLNLRRMFGDVVRLKGKTGTGVKGKTRMAGIEYSRFLKLPF